MERETASRQDEAGRTGRQPERHPCGHEGTATARFENDVVTREEIDTSVAVMSPARDRQLGIELQHRDFERRDLGHRCRVVERSLRSPSVLVWMDLEMTGLEPERHVIVEIATLVTDDQLNIVAEGPDLVIGATPEQLAEMEDIVRHMHSVSGLLPEIAVSTVSVAEAAAETLEFVRSHVPRGGVEPLCGNSIGMDRRFLRRYAPELESWFHYRSVDVSTVKELCKRWRPDLYAARPHKQTAHRAMDDVRESVAELVYYQQHFLAGAAPVDAGADPGVAAAPAPDSATNGSGG